MSALDKNSINPHFINSSLQMMLSDLFADSSPSFAFEPDRVVVYIKDQVNANICICDSAFSRVEKTFLIQGVSSLNHFKIKYNPQNDNVVMIYKLKNMIKLYKGKFPQNKESYIRSTLANSQSACINFKDTSEILNISEINESKKHGINCLITVSTGKTYLLSYKNNNLVINDTNPGGFISTIFKNLASPFLRAQKYFSKCTNLLTDAKQYQNHFYGLVLIDNILQIKQLNLSRKNGQQLSTWQVDLLDCLDPNSQIIKSLFINNGDKSQIKLVLVYHIEKQLAIAVLSMNLSNKTSTIYYIKQLTNMKNEQSHRDLQGLNFSGINSKACAIQLYNKRNHVYLLLKLPILNENSMGYSRFRNLLLSFIVNEKGQIYSKASRQINLLGQFRLAKFLFSKIDKEMIKNQQYQQIFIVSQTNCYKIDEGLMGQNQIFQKIRTEFPPAPQYQENSQTNYTGFIQQNNKGLNIQKQIFGSKKIDKLVNRKQFSQLFRILSLQKNKFRQQIQSEQNAVILGDKLSNHLTSLITLELFTQQHGLNSMLNMQLIKEILFDKDSEKINELFKNKKFQVLTEILNDFFQNQCLSQLYRIFVQTIPNFILGFQTTWNNIQKQNKIVDFASQSKLKQIIIFNIAGRYLPLYQKLITCLYALKKKEKQKNGSSQLDNEDMIDQLKQNKNRSISSPKFSQYDHKQLINKYMQVRQYLLTNKPKNQNCNIETFKNIIQMYLKQFPSFSQFLASVAVKYKSFEILDLLTIYKLATKQDISDFSEIKMNTQQHDNFCLILMNLINREVIQISGSNKNKSNSIVHGLCSIQMIPQKFQHKIYQHLLRTYPRIGVLYGIQIKSRREVANDLHHEIVSSSINISEGVTQPQTILKVYLCLYNCTDSTRIKTDIDLARLFCQSKLKYMSQVEILRSNTKCKINKKDWDNFESRISLYKKEEQIKQLRQNFQIAPI